MFLYNEDDGHNLSLNEVNGFLPRGGAISETDYNTLKTVLRGATKIEYAKGMWYLEKRLTKRLGQVGATFQKIKIPDHSMAWYHSMVHLTPEEASKLKSGDIKRDVFGNLFANRTKIENISKEK